jgi:hypothetical protein
VLNFLNGKIYAQGECCSHHHDGCEHSCDHHNCN